MTATAPRRTPSRRLRLVRRQARPSYLLRDPKPTRLRPWRLNWFHEALKLIVSVAMVIAAVLVWVWKPWL